MSRFQIAKEPNLFDSTSGAALSSSDSESGFSGANGTNKLLGKRARFAPTWVVMSSGTYKNDKIDFNEGVGPLVATITAGVYDRASLELEIKTKMDAAGTDTYTVTYSVTTGKWTVASTGTFSATWFTGTDALGIYLGFIADVSTSATHVSDNAADNMGHFAKADLAGTKVNLLAIERARFAQLDGNTGQVSSKPAALNIVLYGHASDLGDYWRQWEDGATKLATVDATRMGTTPANELFVFYDAAPTSYRFHYLSFQEAASPTNTEGLYPWLEVAYMFAGGTYDADASETRTYAAAFSREIVQPVKKNTLHGNQETSSALVQHQVLTLPFDSFPAATWKITQEAYEAYGLITPFVCLLENGTGSTNDGYSAYFVNFDRNLSLEMQINDFASFDLVLRQQRSDDG